MQTCKPVLFDEGEILQKSRIAVPTEIALSLQLKKCPELPTLWSPLCIYMYFSRGTKVAYRAKTHTFCT